MPREHYLFVTGRMAEPALRRVADAVARQVGFDHTVAVLPITIAGLMTTKWVAKRLVVPPGVTRVMISGLCPGDLGPLKRATGLSVERGPGDLRELPDYFGQRALAAGYGDYTIEILARLPRREEAPLADAIAVAKQLRDDGADVIVCRPQSAAASIGELVRALAGEGCRVAVEARDAAEMEKGVQAGAELVLPVDQSNRTAVAPWRCGAVAVPGLPGTLEGLEQTVEILTKRKRIVRIDPGLSPIGLGLAASLSLYLEARRRWPDTPLAMDLGGLAELTEVDSAGLHLVLLGFCAEVGVTSVLVSQEANWTRSAVRQCDAARRVAHYAVAQRRLALGLDARLTMLHDRRLLPQGEEALRELAETLKDPSFRLFAEDGRLHAICAGVHLSSADPYDLFDLMLPHLRAPVDPRQAFYFGYELAKAAIALNLGKNYRQDEALDWGLLTVRELTRLERRVLRRKGTEGCDDDGSERTEGAQGTGGNGVNRE